MPRITFASATLDMKGDIGTINRIAGHVGDLRKHDRTALSFDTKLNADGNLKICELINNVMLDVTHAYPDKFLIVEPQSPCAGTTLYA